MPIVPRIAPAPLPGPQLSGNVSDAAFGGGAGSVTTGLNQGVSALHNEAAQIAQQERQKALEIGLTANGADLSTIRNSALFGPDGALTKQGKDAFDAPETARANYYAGVGQIRAGIKDDEQRDAFDRMVANDWSQVDEQVQSHVAKQRAAYDTSTTDALVANKQNEALQSYTDPTTVQAAIDAQRGAIAAYGARNGWSNDETTQAVAKQVSTTHVGVLSRMLDAGDDETATAYYTAHKADIAGLDQSKIERALDLGSTLGKASRVSDQIIAGKYAPGLLTPGNIDLTNRPRVQNADGSVSTVRSMSFERDGKEILIPTVSDDGKILTNDEAIAQYDRTGKQLGIFSTADAATAYAQQLHSSQAAMLNGQTTPITAAQALTQAESIENPRVREKAITFVTAHFNELNSAQHIDRENARARVLTAVESNGGRLNEASSDWQLISGYPEGEQVLERQRQILHPAPDPGDPDKLVGYMAMAATNPETRQQLLATPISTIANDPTMNAAQKDRVITLIRGERMKDVSDLRTTHVAAAAAVKAAERDVKQATDDGDDDAIQSSTQRLYDAQQRETVLRGQLTRADRIAHTGPSAASAPTSGASAQPGQPATAPAATPPADARTSANPIGLLPAKPITPEMRRDLLAYGDGYANYLRTLGYDVPTIPSGPLVPAAPAARSAPRRGAPRK